MIDDGALMVAVRTRLAGLAGFVDILWPNEARKVSFPYAIFENGDATPPRTVTLEGYGEAQLRPLISIMTEAGTGTTIDSDSLCDVVGEAFPVGSTLVHPVSGNPIARVTQLPRVSGGRRDGDAWRRDITLYLRAWVRRVP